MQNESQIIKTFDLEKRVPRYTSYPPANHFNTAVTADSFAKWLTAIPPDGRLSLYIHIPFCRNLCWFCACRTQGIKRRLDALYHYIDGVKAEIDLVVAQLGESVLVEHLHLGGGTPTLLPPDLMTELLSHLKRQFRFTDNMAFSVEIDPTEIDADRLNILFDAGLSRASVGVQDFNPIIQQAIGRPQSFEQTKSCFDMLRSGGIDSVNIDLLYGLPHQSAASFATTIDKVLSLAPDRIAMFGYAHVPWMAQRQKLIDAASLPDSATRYRLLAQGRQRFTTSGYVPVGIDHFAKPDDGLVDALNNQTLHRNFQGYTDDRSRYLVGLGASAISCLPQGYAQNASGTQAYLERVQGGKLATSRGYSLTAVDRLHGQIIDQLMCRFEIRPALLRAAYGRIADTLCDLIAADPARYGLMPTADGTAYRIAEMPHVTARLVAHHFDQFATPEKSHSLAV